MNLQKQLRLYLNEQDLTLAKLAKKADVSRSTLNDWLNGAEPKNLKKLKRVADILAIDIDHLVFGNGLQGEINLLSDITLGDFELIIRRSRKPDDKSQAEKNKIIWSDLK